MKEETKKILIALSIIVIIGGIGYFGYQHYKKEVPKEGSETQKIESQQEIVMKELAEKYNALTDWNQNIHYTIQLQDLLVSFGRPILFTGSVDDVFIKNDQYYIRFVTGGWEQWFWNLESTFSETQVYFVLKCDANKALEIIKKRAENDTDFDSLRLFSDNYVVVAKIENVTKPILQISGYPVENGEVELEYEGVELEYESADTFIAMGTCVDSVYIEKDEDNKLSE